MQDPTCVRDLQSRTQAGRQTDTVRLYVCMQGRQNVWLTVVACNSSYYQFAYHHHQQQQHQRLWQLAWVELGSAVAV
jgi:hypothetical protein